MAHWIWACVVVYVTWRAEVLTQAWMRLHHPKEQDPDPIAIPDALEAFALLESELHAQESVRDVIRDRYAELKNWNLVRRAIGVGERDA